MIRIVGVRLLLIPVVLFGVIVAVFLVTRLLPADPVRLIVGDAPITPELRAQIEARYGLDQPALTQFRVYLQDLLQGDLGDSIRFGTPVADLLGHALPATLALAVAGAFIAIVVAVPLALTAARFRDTGYDAVVRGFAMVVLCTPAFYLGLVFILVFSYYLGWFPVSGRGDPPDLHHLILPALVLGLRDAGSSTRVLRASLLDELNEDYVKAARARGFSENRILGKFASRNAAIPAITDMGVNFATLAGQIVLVETVFAYPGVGRMLFQSIQWNDYPAIAGAIMILVIWVLAVNLVVDLLHQFIDPRVRAQG